MYFQEKTFLPFIQQVDCVVTAHANDEGVKKHGKNIVEVTTEHVKCSAVVETLLQKCSAVLETFLQKFRMRHLAQASKEL